MSQAAIISAGVLLFLLLAVLCMRSQGPVIEQVVYDRATRAAAALDADWAEIAVDGRHITMRGFAPSKDARDRLESVIGNLGAVAGLTSELQLRDEEFSPAVERESYDSRMTATTGFVRYSGSVPNEDSRRMLISRTRELFPGRRVEDEMLVREDAPDNWLDAMLNLQQRFATYESAEAVISDNRLNVVGEVAPGRQGERQLLASRLPDNFISEISLAVARGESIETCQRRLDDLMQSKINFEVASEVISPRSYPLLDQLAQRIRECGGLRIEVAGHTDSEGLAMKNLELSQRRAESVTEYLVGQGLDPDQLVPWGYGESRPIEDNATESGRAANRRIEFHAMN